MTLYKKTPTLNARGRYTLVLPWVANPAKLYTCIGIRSFDDIYKLGTDVYTTYYLPMGLTDGVVADGQPFSFAAEAWNPPLMCTLRADDGETIYVPDNFIDTLPVMGEVKYSHIVLSVSLGPQPDYANLSYVKDAVATVVSDTYGFLPAVKEHRAPSSTNPTSEQHEAIEAARIAAIALLETDAAKVRRLTAENNLKQATINTLTDILRSNNIAPFNT